jgi:diguanylate cyclase
MSVVVVDISFALIIATAGAVAGWWLRGSTIRRESRRNDNESRRNREVLAKLYELAARVAADVGQHTNRVEEINEELASAKTQESDVVVTAVARLIQNNEQMQRQLATAQERLREQARQIEFSAAEARTDALTGLANRRALDQEIARRHSEFHREGKNLSLVLIDVDHFKRFNDTYGHQAGDRVLCGLAQVLLQEARELDLVARYGGEEFSLVLPETTIVEAVRFCERIRKAVESKSFHFSGTDLRVTISVGVAQLRAEEEVAALIRRSDAALYASKEAGRNRTYWHDGQTSHPAVNEAAPQAKPETTRTTSPEPAGRCEGNREPTVQPVPTQPLPPPPVEATGDNQSNLCNRTSFCMVLGRRLAEFRRGGEPMSIVLLHVDGYERIVDKFGAQAGELAIRVTTQFLTASFREMDLVAHFQDATFAALLPSAKISNAVNVAERLRQAIARCKFPVGNDRFQFTISLAGAEASPDDDTERLLARAYDALEEAIKAGGNRTCLHNGQWPELVANLPQAEGAAVR